MAQNFQADVRIGMKAELKFKEHLESQGKLIVHINGWWKWWDMVELAFPMTTYEVKNDSWAKDTGNLCIELWSHKTLQNPGWIKYTKADYIIYFISEEEYLKIPTQDIRDYIADPTKMQGKRIVSGWGKGNFNVENVLIPYREITTKIWRTKENG